MYNLLEILDSFDRVVAAAEGVVSTPTVSHAITKGGELRRRRGFQGDTLVLALAGGTGTGKSSLLNAIAGADVARVSPLRPHTDRPLAWLPEERGPALDGLLDDLGIFDRVAQHRHSGLALIDLPDMDSVAEWHRRIVEDLIPRVDGIVWVLDPAKYRDPTLHSGFLGPLADYRDHFVFVLNKVDLLEADARETVVADVQRALTEDGHRDRMVFLTAAMPAAGPPEGITALESHFEELVVDKQIAVRKWLIDAGRELRALGEDAGVWGGASVDLKERWTRDRDAALFGALAESGAGSYSEAVCRLEDLVAMVAVQVGPPIGQSIRDRFPEGSVESVVQEAVRAAGKAAPSVARNKRAKRRADARAVSRAAAVEVVDREIGTPLRRLLDGRARFGAVLAEAVVALEETTAAVGSRPPS